MRNIQVLAAYMMRQISERAESFKGVSPSEGLRKATEELRPEIEASLKSANLSAEELAEVMLVIA